MESFFLSPHRFTLVYPLYIYYLSSTTAAMPIPTLFHCKSDDRLISNIQKSKTTTAQQNLISPRYLSPHWVSLSVPTPSRPRDFLRFSNYYYNLFT